MGTKLLIIGVDGLDYDVIGQLGMRELPMLAPLVADSRPHASTFPPDSVPSWTTMLTGIPPHQHGRLHSKNYILDSATEDPEVGLAGLENLCFWNATPISASVAVINPFLAYPPFATRPNSAMVSGPSFREGPAIVVDPTGRLVGTPPGRLGGFTTVPRQRAIAEFAAETEEIARAQYEYSIGQIASGVWDVVFHTTLTVDRIQHFAWRHFDESDPTHPGREHADIVPSAHRQLDRFLGEALATCDSDARLIVFSDHGHGPRASVGVNLQEIFRRSGLYAIEHRSPARLAVEAGKTAVLSAAPRCHAEGPVIWLARRMPGKAALKSGVFAGRPARGSARVPDLAGSNPYGGIDTGDDDEITARAVEQLNSLRYRGQQVLRWACPTEDIFGTRSAAYPDVLFEFAPQFAPTWNLYGPRFAPIVTRRRLSGGHTRCGVFASNHGQRPAPADSMGVHQALADACRSL